MFSFFVCDKTNVFPLFVLKNMFFQRAEKREIFFRNNLLQGEFFGFIFPTFVMGILKIFFTLFYV